MTIFCLNFAFNLVLENIFFIIVQVYRYTVSVYHYRIQVSGFKTLFVFSLNCFPQLSVSLQLLASVADPQYPPM